MTWMTQTHSTICHTVNEQIPFKALIGDGLVTQIKGHALMMMTADCLPIVLGNAEGTEVANLHAGWRGLAGGIVENTIAAMQNPPAWAWLGAAISQPCFEIGAEVKAVFVINILSWKQLLLRGLLQINFMQIYMQLHVLFCRV